MADIYETTVSMPVYLLGLVVVPDDYSYLESEIQDGTNRKVTYSYI